MNAMTWWDHKTESVWSQPWGRAIAGPLKGTELELIPSQLVPWSTWREAHPETLALEVGGPRFRQERFRAGYVIGVSLGDSATAFPYDLAAQTRVVNDAVGPYPVVVIVNPETRAVFVYLRQVEGEERVLNFLERDGALEDQETGSTWQMERGGAVDGTLKGQILRNVPYVPAFPEAWRDFFPNSRWYDGN